MRQRLKKIKKEKEKEEKEEKKNSTKRKAADFVPPSDPKIIQKDFLRCHNEILQRHNLNIIHDHRQPTEPNFLEEFVQQPQRKKIPENCLELIHKHDAIEKKLEEIKRQSGYGNYSVEEFKKIVKEQNMYPLEPKLDQDYLDQAFRDACQPQPADNQPFQITAMVRSSKFENSSNSSHFQPESHMKESKKPWSGNTTMNSNSDRNHPYDPYVHSLCYPDTRFPKIRVVAKQLDQHHQNLIRHSFEHDQRSEYNNRQAIYADVIELYVDKGGVSKKSKKSSNASEYRNTQENHEINGRNGNAPVESPPNFLTNSWPSSRGNNNQKYGNRSSIHPTLPEFSKPKSINEKHPILTRSANTPDDSTSRRPAVDNQAGPSDVPEYRREPSTPQSPAFIPTSCEFYISGVQRRQK